LEKPYHAKTGYNWDGKSNIRLRNIPGKDKLILNSKNIGFVSTRFAGIDGVSLESSKWAHIFQENGFHCYWFAGELDRDLEVSFLAPEAHFQYIQNKWINKQVFSGNGRKTDVTEVIHELRSLLKAKLHRFINQFKIDLLIVENALTIPMHIPLGISLTELITETQIPTIAHHHDFCWERSRFSPNGVGDYLHMAFPPNLPNIRHVVINSEARKQLSSRKGISSTIIPNVLDFDNPPIVNDKKTEAFREIIGLKPEDKMILQPTRVIQRKGIERAIELVSELKNPRYKLIISHETGDEGFEYFKGLRAHANDLEVDLRTVEAEITNPWTNNEKHKTKFSLWDIYPNAEFITFPSLCEGFGNALLEAIYFKKPILVNKYPVFVKDIEPKGFNFVTIDGVISKTTVQAVRDILESKENQKEMVNSNYEVASHRFSYSILRNQLNPIIGYFFNNSDRQNFPKISVQQHLSTKQSLDNPDLFYDKSERYIAN